MAKASRSQNGYGYGLFYFIDLTNQLFLKEDMSNAGTKITRRIN
jgi:hypothetical protein